MITPKLPIPQNIPPSLAPFVVRDLTRVIDILEPLMAKGDWTAEDYKAYTISTHGIKSAVLNVGATELSQFAKELEAAGNAKDNLTIQAKTPGFLVELKHFAHSIGGAASAPAEKAKGSGTILRAQCQAIAQAARTYQKKEARDALSVLDKYVWPPDIEETIEQMNDCLPHSHFEKMLTLVEALGLV